MLCKTAIAQLVDEIVDGQEMTGDSIAHLRVCPRCASDAHTLRGVWQQAASLPAPSPTDAARLRCAQVVAAAVATGLGRDDRSPLSPLIRRGSMTFTIAGRRAAGIATGIAATAAGLVIGVAIGRGATRHPALPAPAEVGRVLGGRAAEPRFLLLLRRGRDVSEDLPAADRIRVVDEYRAWANRLAQDGRLVIADELGQDAGRVLPASAAPQNASALDGPGSPQWLEGYFIITAPDYDVAMTIAAGCPHLKYGGTIQVREIQQNDHT
jgi:hypothetical protein